ncbi:MAG: inorganic phosphate transporter [Bacteroidetes bacterium]|nr:inorganic phosphate transporter [Bacteroidota bacterium]
MFGLTTGLAILLVICLLLAFFFEFINGFHDTANAVATVIYTNTLKPTVAVVFSGLLNFTGVMLGGITVAMGIVNLLPMEALVDANVYHSVALVMALLLSAIIWNFGTWYFGIPASSSHTVIGAVLGIGFAFYCISDYNGPDPVNWKKAQDTLLFLFVSPLVGFALSIVIMYVFKRLVKNDYIYKEPIPGKKPPLWIRALLTLTCGTVSFVHGQNDGQKGVGLVMLILIAILPGYFAIKSDHDLSVTTANINKIEFLMHKTDTTLLSEKEYHMWKDIETNNASLTAMFAGKKTAEEIDVKERFGIRKSIIKITKGAEKLIEGGNLSLSQNEIGEVQKEVKVAKKFIEYAPQWVIIGISIALGLGTMVGWKRIVKTIGEKIGKQHMSYAQGASAEITASILIGVATWSSKPISTTHSLSSGIAGAMVAKKGLKNLQKKTVKSIILAWVLTLPVTIVLSGSLFLLFRWLL